MKRVLIAFTALMAFGLSACGGTVEAGTVTDKVFKEAWSEEVEITEEECTLDYDTKKVNGKTVKYRDDDCEEVGTGEYETVEHDATYTLVLEDKDGNKGEVSVDEETFNSVDEGEWYGEQE